MPALAFLNIPPDIAPWMYITCITLAMLVIGIGKAGFGAGVGIVATPMIALVISPASRVLAVTLPGLLIGDIISLFLHQRDYATWLLKRLIPAGLLGVVAGALTMRAMQMHVPEKLNFILALAIGSMCLIIVAMQLWRLLGNRTFTLPNGPAMSFIIALTEGFLSTLTNSAGILLTLHLLSHKLSKVHFVTTMLLTFLFINTGKIIAFILLNHLITWETLGTLLPFLPAIPIGAFIGIWLHKRVSDRPFTIVLYTITVVTAVRLIVKVVTG
ncbi:MAG: sulfite exporter TauE/SafE family protein [Phycisphaeraceae bacterium]